MGPRELLAAVEILSAEGRFPRKVVVKEGPNFKEIRHIGDETTVMYANLNGKRYIILKWTRPTPSIKFMIKNNNLLVISTGSYSYVQLAYEEAVKILI